MSSDGSTIAIAVSAAATAASAIATAIMAGYTRRSADKSREMAVAAVAEVKELVRQGTILERQTKATTDQAEAVREQATASIAQAKASTEQLELTRQGLEVTRDSLRASTRPWLTIGHGEESTGRWNMVPVAGTNFSQSAPAIVVVHDGDSVRASVRLWNVGNGIAILDPSMSQLRGWPDQRSDDPGSMMAFTSAKAEDPIVPPGAEGRIDWELDLKYLFSPFPVALR